MLKCAVVVWCCVIELIGPEISMADVLNFVVSFDQGTLLLKGDPCHSAIVDQVFGKDMWTWDQRVSCWRCEAIDYRRVIMALWEAKQKKEQKKDQQRQRESIEPRVNYQDQAKAWCDAIEWKTQHIHPPRPEQTEAIEAWLENKRGVVVMPTGTGKTEVALHLLNQTRCSALIVSPVRDLMYQWHRRILQSLGYDAGVIGDNTFNKKPVSVTTYDSAAIHAAEFGNQFKLIVFDECHHLPGKFRRDAATMALAPYRLGLTATPHRSDGRHADLDFLIGPIAYELDINSVRGKSLSDFEVVKIPVHLSDQEQQVYNDCSSQVREFMHEQRKTAPGFQWQDLCGASAKDPQARQILIAHRTKQAIEDRAVEKLRVIEDLFRLHAGTPVIVFAGSNAMARDISVRFLIPCLLNHCGKKERLEILSGLANGTYPAIVANQVLDEGVDIPAVKVAIVVGGMASTRQAKQRLGRILRKSGNTPAMLYEVVCQDTSEANRSRQRRKSDAYAGTRHRRI